MAQLTFLNGVTPGRTVDLDEGMQHWRIGRGRECEIRLDSDQASRVHAMLILDPEKNADASGSQWMIEDCESLNGTLVNSRPLQRTVLCAGDLIRIGDIMMVFCVDHAAANSLQPAVLGDHTRVRRILGAEKRRIADDPIGADSTSGPVRKLGFLYRLSKEIYQSTDVESLLRYAITAVQQVIGARESRICLRTASGRMRVFVAGSGQTEQDTANMLAGWVIEKDEAVLIDVNENLNPRGPDDSVEKGTILGVPIPGRDHPIGAIECFHPDEDRAFEVADLEFLISVGQHIGLAIESLQQRERIAASNANLRQRLKDTKATFIGECQPLRDLRTQIARVSAADVTVLVLGESGTGKEVVSQMIHELSGRSDGPLVEANCAAFTDSLLESELFGHEKGAFTGADSLRKGRFEAANGGTIFLDEVGELSPNCQAKLLRVLEGQSFQRVGGTKPVDVDVRIVAATHRDLAKMVRAGTFREDLWYRLRVLELKVPPLRERGDDVLHLAEHFLELFARKRGAPILRLSDEATELLQSHTWPGNVRELRNAIERATVLATGDVIEAGDLGIVATAMPVSGHGEVMSLSQLEQTHITRVLKITGGNKTKACEILGITRPALYSKLTRMKESAAS
ncbi:MAG: sigma 54-interacting transcriptional regulator [Planctomycetota bacterium]